jgi:hypothetical protein
MEQPPAPQRERVLTVPNALSVVRLVLVPVLLYLLLAAHADGWATGILIFSGASDWADGKIARLMNQSSRLGELLDPLVDRIYLVTVPIAFGLAKETDTVPAVNQVEVHPYFTNEKVRAYDREHSIATEAWSPIAQGQVLDDPVVERIADAVGKSPAQVVLRWHIQRGDIVFPKSVSPERMKANFALFDFELNGSDVEAMSALDRGESGRTGPNPDEFDYIPG